jgi:adenylate cyclase, class 2
MREIEAKVLEVDVELLRKKLEAMGAKKVFDGEMNASWFGPAQGRVIRLRREGEKKVLCVKTSLKKSGGVRQAQESEMQVESLEETRKVLEGLGYSEKSRATKKRVSYELDGARFEIDSYEGIPPLLEIEAKSAEKVMEGVERLGYQKEDVKPWSFKEVREHYEGERKCRRESRKPKRKGKRNTKKSTAKEASRPPNAKARGQAR